MLKLLRICSRFNLLFFLCLQCMQNWIDCILHGIFHLFFMIKITSQLWRMILTKTWLKSSNFPVICMNNQDINEVRQEEAAGKIFLLLSEPLIPKLQIYCRLCSNCSDCHPHVSKKPLYFTFHSE
jgi:hypothetical protein